MLILLTHDISHLIKLSFHTPKSTRGPDALSQHFLALMLSAPGSLALAPPRGLAVDISSADGRRSQISNSGTSQGPTVDVFRVDGECPRSPASAPPRGPEVDIFRVDSGCPWISSSGSSQGARLQHFLVLMVGAPGSSALTPPRGPAIDIF
jgi:hypothetical protein